MSDNIISMADRLLELRKKQGMLRLPKPEAPLQAAVFEAVCASTSPWGNNDLTLEDKFLMKLWIGGFKVVPLTTDDLDKIERDNSEAKP